MADGIYLSSSSDHRMCARLRRLPTPAAAIHPSNRSYERIDRDLESTEWGEHVLIIVAPPRKDTIVTG